MRIFEGSSNSIGGTTSGAGNVISGNAGPGVEIVGAAAVAWPTTAGGNGHYYLPIPSQSWDSAEALAVSLGGHLVSVNSQAEQNFLTATFLPSLTANPDEIFWIGANDTAVEGTFVWSSGEPFTYSNWHPGEPNNNGGNENYAVMNVHFGAFGSSVKGTWNDTNPNTTYRGLVELTTAPPADLNFAKGNVVQGNMIGVDADGTAPLSNGDAGVRIENAQSNTIGGSTLAVHGNPAANTIAGNQGPGVVLDGPAARSNVVQSNRIGTDKDGNAAIPNAGDGVQIDGASGNTIGGTNSSVGNLISGNQGAGIALGGLGGTGNLVQGNAIGTTAAGNDRLANSGPGILITSAGNTVGGTATSVGNLISGNQGAGIALDGPFATANLVQGNTIGLGLDGATPLGNDAQGIVVNNASNNTIGGTAPGAGNLVVESGSDGIALLAPPELYGSGLPIDFTNPSNPGRLLLGSVSSASDLSATMFTAYSDDSLFIAFRVFDDFIDANPADPGRPVRNDSIELYIDGDRTANDFTPASRAGNAEGFQLASDVLGNQSTLGVGLSNSDWSVATSRFTGGYVVEFRLPLSMIDTIDGSAASQAAGAGSLLRFNAVITDNDRDVSNQDTYSILWRNGSTAPFGDGEVAWVVDLYLDDGKSPGSTAPLLLKAPYRATGLTADGQIGLGATGNVVQGNTVGTNAAATLSLGNHGDGIHVTASNSTIGGTASGAANVVTQNDGAGIAVVSGTGNALRTNRVSDNTGMEIKLGTSPLPTVNDLNDPDTGANNLQNTPVLTTATVGGTKTTIGGILNSTPFTTFQLDIFASPYPEASGQGQAAQYLGSTTLTTSVSGSASWSFTYNGLLPAHQVLTATATDPAGNTSELAFGFAQNNSPHADAGPDLNGTEGTPILFNGTASADDDGDSLTYFWDFGDGKTGNGATPSHSYDDNGTYNVSLTVTDPFGGSSGATLTVLVANAAPTFAPGALTLNQPTYQENGLVKLSATITDPGTNDNETAIIDWGDGSPTTTVVMAPGVRTFSDIPHQYLDDAPGLADQYTITVKATDNDGGTGTGTRSVTVMNVAPATSSLIFSQTTLNENDSTTLGGMILDPGTLDSHTLTIDWGDGSDATVVDMPAGRLTFSEPHRYLNNPADARSGPYTVTVRVTDKDLDLSGTIPTSTLVDAITVMNVRPTLAIHTAASSSDSVVALNAVITDPGTLDPHTFTWSVTKDGLPYASGTGSTFSFTRQENSTFVVTATVLDDFDTATSTVLYFGGTAGDDTIHVDPAGADQVTISNNTQMIGTFPAGDSVLVFGGSGGDTIEASAALMTPVELNGGGGNDSITGGGADDMLIGGPGANTLSGGQGDDMLVSDTAELDSLSGGTGNDTYLIIPGGDPIVDETGDTTGIDTLDFSQAVMGVTVDLTKTSGELQTVDDRGDELALQGSFENVTGTTYNDTITGSDTGGVIKSGGGSDYLIGGSGTDTIVGGSGNSGIPDGETTIYGGGGNDIIFGGYGNDSIVGGAGNDSTTGGSGDATIYGGGGNDIIYGGYGNDSISGGSGNSTPTSGDATIYGGGGNDIIFGGTGNDSILGGSGNVGDDGSATIYGGGGNDIIFGGYGNDSISGGSSENSVVDGQATIYGGGGNDIIYGGYGNDSISGGSGNGTPTSGDATIYGGGGNDIIFGGYGNDSLSGGSGNSTPTSGNATIYGGGGNDIIYGGYGNDSIVGGAGNDSMTSGNATIYGGGGNDIIYGGYGNDSILGGSGNAGDDGSATIYGGGGNDIIFGGYGNDSIVGGSGNVGDDWQRHDLRRWWQRHHLRRIR